MTTEIGIRLKAPVITERDIETLSHCLRGSGWVTAATLSTFFNDRTLRAIAEASNGRIISGQRGYALMSECTPEEIDRAASWLESQAKKMLARATAIRRRFHSFGKQPHPNHA